MSETTEHAGDSAAEQAAFDSGFGAEAEPTTEKPETKVEATPATPANADPEAEFVKITKKEWDDIKALALKLPSYDKQIARNFGQIGHVQTLINEVKAALKEDKPDGAAFAKLKEQFPELADMTQEAVTNALAGNGKIDPETIKAVAAEVATAREIEALDDAYPDWRDIVGVVGADEQPDPENPFRKWLATKDDAYQARVNASESSKVIERAIDRFKAETAPKPTAPRANARAAVVAAAVQPAGDGGAPSSRNTAEEAFAAGFGA